MRIFVVDPSEEVREEIARRLDDGRPWIGHDSLAQLAQAIDAGQLPAIVITGPGIVHDDTVMLASSVQDEAIPAALVQVTKVLEPDALRSALRAGVADVVELDGPAQELRDAVERAGVQAMRIAGRLGTQAPLDSAVTGLHATPVIAFVAGKGGVGTSFVCTNLAAALAAQGHDVVAIDLDVAGGDLGIMLMQRPILTVVDAVRRIENLDEEALPGYLMDVRAGLRLLPAPLDGMGEVDSMAFMQLLDLVMKSTDVIVIDAGNATSPVARDVLATADHVVVVATRELTAIRGARLAMERVEASGQPRGSITLVANKSDQATSLTIADIEKALHTSVDHQVPTDKNGSQAVNRGEPVIDRRRSKSGMAIRDLASLVASELEL